MISHDNKIMDAKAAGSNIGSEHVKEQIGHPLCLQKGPALAGPGTDEKNAAMLLYFAKATTFLLGEPWWQRLKPDHFKAVDGPSKLVP
jgi:hypothetical protein